MPQTNLALITCPNLKQKVSVDLLDTWFSSEVGFICPTKVLKIITNLQWLGFAWNTEQRLLFSGNHLSAPNCDHLHSLPHFGGRSFLSTTSGTITANVGQVDRCLTVGSVQFSGNVFFFFHVLLPFENKDSEVFKRLLVYSIYICELLLIMNYIYICKQLL